MTIEQWLLKSTVNPIGYPYGQWRDLDVLAIPDVVSNEHIRRHLWDLDDFRVSSVNGGTIWLIRRSTT